MILAAFAAIAQTNIKRLMAYSSIGHIGYALAGVATGNIPGYQSAIVYITIYVIMNIGIFSCLYLLKKDGEYRENISDLSGLSKKQPLLAALGETTCPGYFTSSLKKWHFDNFTFKP